MANAVRLRLLRRLAEGRGRVVTREALIFAMYADQLDQPGRPDLVLSVLACMLRKDLPAGALVCERGQGYRLDAALCERFLAENDDAHVVLARLPQDEARFLALRSVATA